MAPTASNGAVSGRVVNSRGKGVRGINLTLFDASSGEMHYASTNSFGFYSCTQLELSTFYVLTARANKRYTIVDNVRSFTLNDDLANVEFVAEQIW